MTSRKLGNNFGMLGSSLEAILFQSRGQGIKELPNRFGFSKRYNVNLVRSVGIQLSKTLRDATVSPLL